MAKKMTASEYQGGNSVSRPGVHAKTKTSSNKTQRIIRKLIEDKDDE